MTPAETDVGVMPFGFGEFLRLAVRRRALLGNCGIETSARCGARRPSVPNQEPVPESVGLHHSSVAERRRDKGCMFSRPEPRSCAPSHQCLKPSTTTTSSRFGIVRLQPSRIGVSSSCEIYNLGRLTLAFQRLGFHDVESVTVNEERVLPKQVVQLRNQDESSGMVSASSWLRVRSTCAEVSFIAHSSFKDTRARWKSHVIVRCGCLSLPPEESVQRYGHSAIPLWFQVRRLQAHRQVIAGDLRNDTIDPARRADCELAGLRFISQACAFRGVLRICPNLPGDGPELTSSRQCLH